MPSLRWQDGGKALELGEIAATESMDALPAADVHLWGQGPQTPTAVLKGLMPCHCR